MAPQIVAGALKGAIFFAATVFDKLGYGVLPDAHEPRHDIIQAIELGTPEGVIAFCQGIQAAAPVDSYVVPEPWAMQGMIQKSLWQLELLYKDHLLNLVLMLPLNRLIPYSFKVGYLGIMQNLVWLMLCKR